MAVWQQWPMAEKKAYIGTEAPAKDKEFLQYFAKESTEISDWQNLPDDVFIELTFHYDSKIVQKILSKILMNNTEILSLRSF